MGEVKKEREKEERRRSGMTSSGTFAGSGLVALASVEGFIDSERSNEWTHQDAIHPPSPPPPPTPPPPSPPPPPPPQKRSVRAEDFGIVAERSEQDLVFEEKRLTT